MVILHRRFVCERLELNATPKPRDGGKLASGKSNDVENPFWAPHCNIMSVLYLCECKSKALCQQNGVILRAQASHGKKQTQCRIRNKEPTFLSPSTSFHLPHAALRNCHRIVGGISSLCHSSSSLSLWAEFFLSDILWFFMQRRVLGLTHVFSGSHLTHDQIGQCYQLWTLSSNRNPLPQHA